MAAATLAPHGGHGVATVGPQDGCLRVLQEKEFERVGGTQTIHVDSRVIAATNKSLLDEVQKGRFREDLYYRLNVIPIHMPLLRERGGDVLLLVGHFLDRHRFAPGRPPAAIAPDAVAVLERYRWPGNVGELRDTLERAVTLARGGQITPVHLGTITD